jgi:hypothetical protein
VANPKPSRIVQRSRSPDRALGRTAVDSATLTSREVWRATSLGADAGIEAPIASDSERGFGVKVTSMETSAAGALVGVSSNSFKGRMD